VGPYAPGRALRPAAIAFAVLLAATAGAFFLSGLLKSQPSEIELIKRNLFFSPNGDGRRDREKLVFKLDEAATAAVDIVDADGARVRRVREELRLRPGRRTRVVWDGRDDAGRVAPDGDYRMRLILGKGRSLLAPRFFLLDTEPPQPEVLVDQDAPIVLPGTPVRFSVEGVEAGPPPEFGVLRTDVSPPQEVRALPGQAGRAEYAWDGRTASGAPAPPGTYLIAATAFDRAGNAGRSAALPLPRGGVGGRAGVTLREAAVQPPVRAVGAGEPVNVRVDARGRAFTWTLRRLGGEGAVLRGSRPAGRTSVLLRAPRGRSGVHVLTVRTTGGATARAPIAVRSRGRPDLLVVLPMITWLGRDPVDLSRDGVPDTFAAGVDVRFPRPFAFPGGMPPAFGREVAPLLEFLDGEEIPYDLVTDLDLVFGGEPGERREGVLLPAGGQWTTRPLARRLRAYVERGGRVGVFGPRALTGTATVEEGVLTRPSPLTDADAFGGRLAFMGEVEAPLVVLEEDPALGLLEGFSGQLGGFASAEELASPGEGTVRTSVGGETTELRPALSATRYGQGLVVRVGLPGWGERLRSGDAAVAQLTRNLADVLRGVRPRVRTARG
jgi:hypothetical protein